MNDVLQHNTCPICRKTLGKPAADAEETNVHETTDASDSSSSDSSDSDVNSDSSNENVINTTVSDSLPAPDGERDCIADEPTASAAVVLDTNLWNIQSDGSTRLSSTHQMEQDNHPRSRSSSSSSSEYSSL